MAPILNTPLLAITGSPIQVSWNTTDVVPYSGDPFEKFMNLHIDLSLYDHGWIFVANFAIVEVETNLRFNDYWIGNLDGLPRGDIWISMAWDSASQAGVSKSSYSYSGNTQGDGVYLYRPYFAVQVPGPSGEIYTFDGASQYAVSEEHYFLLESSA